MRNNDLQEQIPSWSSLLLFSIDQKNWRRYMGGRLEVPIWLVLNVRWWWTREEQERSKRGAREEQERAQKGKKRTNFAQTISGWTVGCFPKVANPQSEPACAQRISQIWTILTKMSPSDLDPLFAHNTGEFQEPPTKRSLRCFQLSSLSFDLTLQSVSVDDRIVTIEGYS